MSPDTAPAPDANLGLLQAFHEASDVILATHDPVRVLEAFDNFLDHRFPTAHLALVHHADAGRLEIVARSQGGKVATADETSDLRAYPGVLARLETVAIPDVGAATGLSDEERTVLRAESVRSLVVLPLAVQQRLTGLVYLSSSEPVALSKERLRALRSLAAQTAVVLENRRLKTGLQRRAEQLERVTAFGQSTQDTDDVAVILDRMITATVDTIPVHRIAIGIYDADSDAMRLAAQYRDGARAVTASGGASFTAEAALMSRAWQTARVEYIPDLDRADVWRSAITEGIRSYIVSPLSSRGQLIGVVVAGNGAPNAYTDSDISVFYQLATQLAIALQNARLFQQTQAQALRERKASQVANAMMGATDVRSLLDLAAEQFNDALGAVYTRVYLEPEGIDEAGARRQGGAGT